MSNHNTKLEMLKAEAVQAYSNAVVNALSRKPVYNPLHQLSEKDKLRWTSLALDPSEYFKIGHKLLSIFVPLPDQKLMESTPRKWQTFDEKNLTDDEKGYNYEQLICQVVRAMVIRNDLEGVSKFFSRSHPFYQQRLTALKCWYMAMDSWHDGTFNPMVESALWEIAYGETDPYLADPEDFKNSFDWTEQEIKMCWHNVICTFLCLCAYSHVSRDQVQWFVHDAVFRYNRCAVFRNYLRAIRLVRGDEVKQPEMKLYKEQDLWNCLFGRYTHDSLAQNVKREDLGTAVCNYIGDNDAIPKAKLEWLYAKAGRPPLIDREVFDIATAGFNHRIQDFVLTPDNPICAIMGFELAKEVVDLEMKWLKVNRPELFEDAATENQNNTSRPESENARMD